MLFDTYECNLEAISKNDLEESFEILGSNGVRISKLVPPGKLLRSLYGEVETIIDSIERGCRVSDNGRCVGWKSSKSEYSWISYKDFINKAQNFGAGLEKATVKLGQSSRIGIYAQNSVEWLVAQYGCLYNCSPIVPLYDSIGPNARTFMINHAELEVIICDTEKKVRACLEKSEETGILKYIIHVQNVNEETKMLGQRKNIKLYPFAEIEELGKSIPRSVKRPKPTDVAIVLYTSGTTGDPKGVILSHKNYIAGVSGVIIQMAHVIRPSKDDVSISYLPLAHAFEQIVQMFLFINGGSVGFFSGDISLITEDMKVLKPTIFPVVPRLLTKFQDKIKSLADKLKRNASENGFEQKDNESCERVENQTDDSLVYKTLSHLLGGKVRLIFTGSAPVSESTLTFYKKALGCVIVEGYGQTECSGCCNGNIVSIETLGTIGPPTSNVMIKLVDVPELGYFKDDKIGEVCVKGPTVFSGYLKNPTQTAEAIDEDGWLHTGDVGQWLPNGTLRIVDRKKNIFKLSQGEYVMPEKIESVYLESPLISQIFVDGDSLQSFLVGIVIPEEKELMEWCEMNSIKGTWKEICQNQDVKEHILEDMKRVAKTTGLVSFHQVKDIHVHPDLLTVEDGHLTPTQKTKRHFVKKCFSKEIQTMYIKC